MSIHCSCCLPSSTKEIENWAIKNYCMLTGCLLPGGQRQSRAGPCVILRNQHPPGAMYRVVMTSYDSHSVLFLTKYPHFGNGLSYYLIFNLPEQFGIFDSNTDIKKITRTSHLHSIFTTPPFIISHSRPLPE